MNRRALEALAQFPERGLFCGDSFRWRAIPVQPCSMSASPVWAEGQSSLVGSWRWGAGRRSFHGHSASCADFLPERRDRPFGTGGAGQTGDRHAGVIGAVTLTSVWLLGGAPTWAVGAVGLYAGSAQQEAGQRPRYLIEEILDGGEPRQARHRRVRPRQNTLRQTCTVSANVSALPAGDACRKHKGAWGYPTEMRGGAVPFWNRPTAMEKTACLRAQIERDKPK